MSVQVNPRHHMATIHGRFPSVSDGNPASAITRLITAGESKNSRLLFHLVDDRVDVLPHVGFIYQLTPVGLVDALLNVGLELREEWIRRAFFPHPYSTQRRVDLTVRPLKSLFFSVSLSELLNQSPFDNEKSLERDPGGERLFDPTSLAQSNRIMLRALAFDKQKLVATPRQNVPTTGWEIVVAGDLRQNMLAISRERHTFAVRMTQYTVAGKSSPKHRPTRQLATSEA
jgi:hypothetical protein